MSRFTSRKMMIAGIVLPLLLATGAVLLLLPYRSRDPIKVGILCSETGTMAISETSVRDAALLAIKEINARGGLLGRRIEPVIGNGASRADTFAREAERLIGKEKVRVLFGCWTSASRKSVHPVLEKHKHLLFYPVQYEGLEQSPYIVYTGAAPNQQLVPGVKWCVDKLVAQRFFLVGSDYVFPHTANAIMTSQIKALGGEVVGERYLLLNSPDERAIQRAIQEIVREIVTARPDVILNTINGDSNVAFFRQLREAGVTPEDTPAMSFSIAEDELRSMDPRTMAGDYATWNYFQSIRRKENQDFVASFQREFGPERVTDDPMEAAYFSVHLWAQAVEDAGTDDVAAVRGRLPLQSYPAPGGIVSIDPDNQHTWKTVRVGRIGADGQFDIVWTSKGPVRPLPFPQSRSRQQWDEFLTGLSERWQGNWSNPGP